MLKHKIENANHSNYKSIYNFYKNPDFHGVIFLWGPTCSGKSCLARQLEQQLCGEFTIWNSCMTEFLEAAIEELRKNIGSFSVSEFCDKYDHIDLFILEDTHEIKERSFTQVFLSNLFAELNRRKKKILVVSTGTLEEMSEFYELLCLKLGEDCIQVEMK